MKNMKLSCLAAALWLSASMVSAAVGLPGNYNGLFYETTGIAHHSAGFFNLRMGPNNKVGGKLFLDGDAVTFTGPCNPDGTFTKTVSRLKFGKSDLTVTLDFPSGTDQATGTVSDGANWTAEILADRQLWQFNGVIPGTQLSAPPNPAALYARAYTMVIPGFDNNADGPVGYGYATITVNNVGRITLVGYLADGVTFKQLTYLSQDGKWPFFAPAYNDKQDVILDKTLTRNRGETIGWLNFTANTNAYLENTNLAPLGRVAWIKTAWTNASWTGGFTNGVMNHLTVMSSQHIPPVPGATTAIYPFTNGLVFLSEGALSETITNSVLLKTNSTFFVNRYNTNDIPYYNHKFAAALASKVGYIYGNFTNDGALKPILWKGAMLQDYTNSTMGYGFFVNPATTNASGRVTLQRNDP